MKLFIVLLCYEMQRTSWYQFSRSGFVCYLNKRLRRERDGAIDIDNEFLYKDHDRWSVIAIDFLMYVISPVLKPLCLRNHVNFTVSGLDLFNSRFSFLSSAKL